MVYVADVSRFNEQFVKLRLAVTYQERILTSLLKEAYKYCNGFHQRLAIFDMFYDISMREALVIGLEEEHIQIVNDAVTHYKSTLEVLQSRTLGAVDSTGTTRIQSRASHAHTSSSVLSTMDALPSSFFSYHRATPVIDEITRLRVVEQRLQEPWKTIQKLPQACLSSKLGNNLYTLFTKSIEEVNRQREAALTHWHTSVSSLSSSCLSNKLLLREKMVIHNEEEAAMASRHRLPVFRIKLPDDLLQRIREAKFLHRHGFDIGENMEILCEQHESLHVVLSKLQMALNIYNHLRVKLDKHERPLYYDIFPRLVESLTRATSDFSFSSSGLSDYLSMLNDILVDGFQSRLDTIAQARGELDAIVDRWNASTLIQGGFRDDILHLRPLSAQDFENFHKSCMKKMRLMLTTDSQRLEELLNKCLHASYVTSSSPAWEDFLRYQDDKIFSGVHKLILSALNKIYHCVSVPHSMAKAVVCIEVRVNEE